MAQKEIVDLQKQVTVLLKECCDIQLRCGSTGHDDADDCTATVAVEMDVQSDAEKVISERLMKREIKELRRQRDFAQSQVDELQKKLQEDQRLQAHWNQHHVHRSNLEL
ncbi:nuclear-pore anchor-like [Ricinus communis]|uniref:nuclear-pore anchor-like n=1 Tax=Ricinus communis TaxID=3988 RepID=UPI00201A449D|nr:nuclear-pore anchor-like [Ricinus communis]